MVPALTNRRPTRIFSRQPISAMHIETLESRQLLHGGFGGHQIRSIAFDLTPSAVQTELNTLTGTTLSSTQSVALGNSNGVETYTVTIKGTGTVSRYTVDVNGDPLTSPTKTTTTFGEITNTSVTGEFNAIATGLGLTAPASTDSVKVSTPTSGAVVYTLRLVNPSNSRRGVRISVDDSGNPVGNEQVPFSALSSTIQNSLNGAAPAGATPIDSSSTQRVNVRTVDGVTTYSVTFSTTGVRTTVTVDTSGTLTSLPSTKTDLFSDIPVAAQNELNALATAEGITTAIDSSQSVKEYDEANGTVIYSASLSGAPNSSGTGTHTITISTDANGNPTVPPNEGFGIGGCGGGIFGGGGFEGFARRFLRGRF